MYQRLNTIIIVGTFDEESTSKIKVDFILFEEKDIKFKLPPGGAFCNHKDCLYFSGRKENTDIWKNFFKNMCSK